MVRRRPIRQLARQRAAHGAQDGTTTEDGAYRLTDGPSGVAPAVNRFNPNTGEPPKFRLPTEDEWYKAAYFSPKIGTPQPYILPQARSTNPNTSRVPAYRLPSENQWYKAAYYDPTGRHYFTYATRSDEAPGNTVGSAPNQANYQRVDFTTTGSPNFSVTANYLTNVGAFTGSAGPFGTFDQNGNLQEWLAQDSPGRVTAPFRGGFWQDVGSQTGMASLDRLDYPPLSESDAVGFRVASAGPAARSQVGAPKAALQFQPVGSPGNSADPLTNLGAVAEPFELGRYEVTIGQYAAFLNAVAASDPNQLFNPRMQVEPNLAGISRSGSDGSYRYSVMANFGDSGSRPIGWVSWFDAVRFVNWLDNGQPTGPQSGETTEDGVYDLSGAPAWPAMPNPSSSTAPVPVGDGGYYAFATASNVAPGNLVGPQPNQANSINAQGQMAVTQQVGIDPNRNYLTEVGAFTNSASHYGTFDQIGNVYEWNDLSGTTGPARGIRGSAYFGALYYALDIAKDSRAATLPGDYGYGVGFRVAGP